MPPLLPSHARPFQTILISSPHQQYLQKDDLWRNDDADDDDENKRTGDGIYCTQSSSGKLADIAGDRGAVVVMPPLLSLVQASTWTHNHLA